MAEAASTGAALVNVLRREMGASWRSALGWWLPTAAMLTMTLALQPEMAETGSMFEQKLALMPKAMLVAFGIEAKNLADPLYYLATNFTLIQLLGAMFAALLGSAALAREEAFGTSEMLYAMPVRRRTVALGKAAAGLALVLVFDAGLLAAAWGTYAGIGAEIGAPGAMVGLFAAAGALHAAVYGLALAATVRLARPRSATSVGLALVFGLYGLGVVGALSASLSALRKLSPFAYAEPMRVIEAGGASSGTLVLTAVAAVTVAAAVVMLERKDIHA